MVTGRLGVMAPQRATFKRLMGWGYRTLEDELKTNAGWRWVSGIYGETVPRFQTIQTREAMLREPTLALINRRVMACAMELDLTTGKQLRKVAQPLERAARLRGAMDSSATDSDIHYPTDSGLLDDSARVLSRTFKRARKIVQPKDAEEKVWFREGGPSRGHRHRQAHRLAWKIAKQARKVAQPLERAARLRGAKTEKSSPKAYADLLKIVEVLIEQAQQVQLRLKKLTGYAAQKLWPLEGPLSSALEHYVPLVQQVVWQTRQRVINKLNVEASSKLLSLFEPHTAIIIRGKAKPKDVEFGHKVWFSEVEGGFISEYRISDGNPSDDRFVIPAIHHHRRLFGHVPVECAGDRGLHSANNERQVKALGVHGPAAGHLRVSLPMPGYKSESGPLRPRGPFEGLGHERKQFEHQPWFRAAQRFRNGIEGRISQLRRARHLNRDTPLRGCCLNVGAFGFHRWIAWGVIANNIAILATHLAQANS